MDLAVATLCVVIALFASSGGVLLGALVILSSNRPRKGRH